MIAAISPIKTSSLVSKKKIDPRLIYEIFDGKPVYYRGFKEVVKGVKSIEEVMGSSSLQGAIIEYLLMYVLRALDLKKYRALTNEIGLHLDKKNNLAGDLCIYEKELMPVKNADKHFSSIPPKIQIEVDIDADIEGFESVDNYIFRKTDKLLNFGVEKVIWILSNSKKVIVATKNKNWEVIDWYKDIQILENIHFNIGQYLKEEGSPFA